ncbi:hypothetical protein AAF712_005062 [Marasmius tenuissimus]|uniref:F-box domain-containing protein n=1 Tax=Marasmius tenuissimus TaxID=585030 RepID=A0ABR3A3E3_9AGAR
MDFPASLSLVGLDPFLSEDDATILRQMLEKDEKLMESLDEEIAQVQATLASLTAKRNTVLQRVTQHTAPSEAELQAIRANISEGEQRLHSLEVEIGTARTHLDSLTEQKQRDAQPAGSLESSSSGSPRITISSDDSIDRHKGIVKVLENERDHIISTLARYNALISPIRLLPLEVMSQIFLLCLSDSPFVPPSPSDAPLILTQVCRSWRDIALSTPGLWASIAITVHKTHCEPPASVIETWLQRSKLHPISFAIDERLQLEDFTANKDLITGATIMEKFLPAYNRWKRVCLTHSDWRINEMGIADIRVDRGPPPLLEALYMSREYWLGNVRDPLRMLLAAPKLKSVHWRGIIAGYLSPAEIIPVERLSEVKMDNLLTMEQFYSILSSGSNLVKCNFTVFLAGAEDSTQEWTLPQLRELDIVADRADGRLFNVITTPAMGDLSIRRIDGPPSVFQLIGERFWGQASFLSFLSRSICSLHTLELADTDITPNELLEVLGLVSGTLKSLSLSNDHSEHNCVNDEVLLLLMLPATPSETQPGLCPNLTYLKLWGCMTTQDGQISRTLESRWDAKGDGKSLDMVMIKFSHDDRHPIDIARFREMNERRRGITWIRNRP